MTVTRNHADGPTPPCPARLNEEFSEYAWVPPTDLGAYDLNATTRDTLTALGILTAP